MTDTVTRLVRSPALLVPAGLTLLTAAVYAPVVTSWFVGDDFEEILGATSGGARSTQVLHAGRNNRPLHRGLLAAVNELAGLQPVVFHLVSLALHVVAAVLVVVLAGRLLDGRVGIRPGTLAAVAGALFVVAPNHTEAVAWVSAQADVTMTCLYLGALLCWITDTRSGRVAAAVGFALALLAKETAVTFPFTVVAYELSRTGAAFDGRRLRRSLTMPWPLHLVLAAYIATRWVRFGGENETYLVREAFDQPVAALARRTVATIIRTWLPGMGPWGWSLAAAIGLTFVVALARTRHRPAAAPAPWFAMIASVLTVVPVAHLGASATGPAGERLVYLPSAFAAIVVAWVIGRIAETARRQVALATGLGLAAVVLLVGSNVEWRAAADLSRSSTDELVRLDPKRHAYVIGAPDNLRGQLVLRNGLAPAFTLLHGGSEPLVLDEIATVDAVGVADLIEVRPAGRPRTWTVRLVTPGATFGRIATADEGWWLIGVRVHRRSSDTFDLTLAAEIDPADVWYFSGGRLTRLQG